MRLSFAFLAAALAVLSSGCDAGQNKISTVATQGMAQAEDVAPVANRLLRGFKAENEERGASTTVSTSLDNVVNILNSKKSTFTKLVDQTMLNKWVSSQYIQTLRSNRDSYMKKVFTEKNLNNLLVKEPLAEKTFLQWYALGLTDDLIKARLSKFGEHFGILHTQYVGFINRLHGVA